MRSDTKILAIPMRSELHEAIKGHVNAEGGSMATWARHVLKRALDEELQSASLLKRQRMADAIEFSEGAFLA